VNQAKESLTIGDNAASPALLRYTTSEFQSWGHPSSSLSEASEFCTILSFPPTSGVQVIQVTEGYRGLTGMTDVAIIFQRWKMNDETVEQRCKPKVSRIDQTISSSSLI
jgi:hypothetical protein